MIILKLLRSEFACCCDKSALQYVCRAEQTGVYFLDVSLNIVEDVQTLGKIGLIHLCLDGYKATEIVFIFICLVY